MNRIAYALLLLGFLLVLAILPAAAQDAPVQLESVFPPELPAGIEHLIVVTGSGFEAAAIESVTLDDLEVGQVQVVADDVLHVDVAIPGEAAPGSRELVVSGQADGQPFTVALEAGLFVLPPDAASAGVALTAVEPPVVEPGAATELRLLGSGFSLAEQLEVTVEGIEVSGMSVFDDGELRLKVMVPDDAPPGHRAIVVNATVGGVTETARLDQGVVVASAGAEAGPTSGSANQDDRPAVGLAIPRWALILLGMLFFGLVLLFGLLAGILVGAFLLGGRHDWRRQARQRWQVAARVTLPEAHQPGAWACQMTPHPQLDERWAVRALRLTPLPSGANTPAARTISGPTLERLNDLAQLPDDQARLRRALVPVAEALVAEALAWNEAGQAPAALRLDVELAQPLSARFALYQVRQTDDGLAWSEAPRLSWRARLDQGAQPHLGVVRGPAAGESVYAVRLQQELTDLLVDLVRAAKPSG